MRFLFGRIACKLAIFSLLLGCSDVATEPVAPTGSRPELAALSFQIRTRLSLGSHTNLLGGEDDEFNGPVPFLGAAVRFTTAKGTLIATGSTNEAGEFELQSSKVPTRLEYALPDGTTYTFALGSVDVGTMIVHAKLEYQGPTRVMNAELFPDDELDDVPDDAIATEVVGRMAGHPGSGSLTTTALELVNATADELEAIVLANPGTPLADKVEDVLAKTRVAAAELAKSPSDKEAALGNLEGAVGDLESVVKDALPDVVTGTRLMEQMAVVGRQVATEELDRAIAWSRSSALIGESQGYIAAGDALRRNGRAKDAMAKYKDALSKARSALS